MNRPLRIITLTLLGAGLVLGTTAFQIGEYPFGKSRFGRAEGTRKVYRNMPDPELKKVMKTMGDALGVGCTYCHDTKDYTSEEKPPKDFSRHKVQMVQWLNAKYRPGAAKWEYNCYSCHRGVVKPVPSAPPAGK
jgi:hypothetical protein